MKVIGYLRVSTDEQGRTGHGLEAQRAKITAEAEHRGWDVHWMADEGYSAKSLSRPAVSQALAMLKRREADALVVAKLDRLSRSVVDFANTLRTAQRQGWAVVALDLGVDTSTPTGELVAGVMMQVAQWERRVIGQRTAEALQAAQSRGVRVGRPPAVPDDVLTRIHSARVAGASYRAIAADLNADAIPTAHGGAAWHPTTVSRIHKRSAA